MRKVSIGCGFKYAGSEFTNESWSEEQKEQEKKKIAEYSDFIGVDKGDYGQHHVRDLRRGLPFDSNSVDLIVADNILEHIPPIDTFGQDDYIFVMNECLRVLKVGGRMKIVVPNGGTRSDFKDPTHFRTFTDNTFSYMELGNVWEYGFKKGWKVLNSSLSNKHEGIIYAELEKVKDVR